MKPKALQTWVCLGVVGKRVCAVRQIRGQGHQQEQLCSGPQNYVSCHEVNRDNPLLWPNVEYQVLGGRTNNRIIFGQRNGIYTFHLSVVDPFYSYCNLNTVFSVYVYGALPLIKFRPLLSIFLIVATTLLMVWLAYAIPKQLRTERGQRLVGFCSRICHYCLDICTCAWLRGQLRRGLRSRKVKDQTRKMPLASKSVVQKQSKT